MKIRITPEAFQREKISFLLIDQSYFIFKKDYNKSNALKSDCKHRINKLLEFFTLTWEHASEDEQSKRLSI